MPRPPEELAALVAGRIAALPATDRRRLVGIAGPPASGKSSLAEALVARLGEQAVLVPMDGFHLDNRLLDARGLRHRKGAPETFDADGFSHAIWRLREAPQVVLPIFDRERDLSVAGAISVTERHRIAVVEGNYLLFDELPWRYLSGLWDLSVWTAPPEDVLRQRLVARWQAHGLAPAAARSRAETNDIPNARRVLNALLPADLTL